MIVSTLYRSLIEFALGDPPDWGVKNARIEGMAWPKAGGFYSGAVRTRLMTIGTRAGGSPAPPRPARPEHPVSCP